MIPEKIHEEVVSLPISSILEDTEVETIISVLNNF